MAIELIGASLIYKYLDLFMNYITQIFTRKLAMHIAEDYWTCTITLWLRNSDLKWNILTLNLEQEYNASLIVGTCFNRFVQVPTL